MQRLAVEVYDVIRDKDWASVGGSGGRLWNVDKFYRTMGSVNGGGVGGSLPIAIGGALAHKKHGRLCVRFQPDGDMLYVNSALWTATHHRIPMLFVMHNNRAYHQEVMHLQRMANRRQRGMALAHGGLAGIDDQRSRTSISRRWLAAWAPTRKDQSRIRKICGRRCCGLSNGSRRAKSHCSTPLTQPR